METQDYRLERESLMKIGELSKSAGVSRSTIRNYVRAGLLPTPKKVGINLFLYSKEHLDRILLIQKLRKQDNLSLEQISDVFNSRDFAYHIDSNDLACRNSIEDPLEDSLIEANYDKSRQIIDKAIELFNTLGYERVRVSDITDALNLGKGTFYRYFENKEQLLLRCFERLEELILSLEKREEVRQETGFFAKHRPRFEGFRENYSKFAGIMHLIRTASWSPDPEISSKARDSYASIINPLRLDLEDSIRRGEARQVDSELAIYAFVGMADNIAYRATLDERYEGADVDDFFEDWIKVGLQLKASVPTVPASREDSPEWELVDRSGFSVAVRDLNFGELTNLVCRVGNLDAELDSSLVVRIVFECGEANQCSAEATLRDGTKALLEVDGDLVVSGKSPFGAVRTSIRQVASLSHMPSAEDYTPTDPSPINEELTRSVSGL